MENILIVNKQYWEQSIVFQILKKKKNNNNKLRRIFSFTISPKSELNNEFISFGISSST